jgi:hypothetical protein
LFFYSEDRRREAQTRRPLFFFSELGRRDHTPGPGKYYCYYSEERRREAFILTSVLFIITEDRRGEVHTRTRKVSL